MLRHLPVPAKELEILRLPIYTFGGVGLPDTMISEAIAWGASRAGDPGHARRGAPRDDRTLGCRGSTGLTGRTNDEQARLPVGRRARSFVSWPRLH
jgi:hypothetical protein